MKTWPSLKARTMVDKKKLSVDNYWILSDIVKKRNEKINHEFHRCCLCGVLNHSRICNFCYKEELDKQTKT